MSVNGVSDSDLLNTCLRVARQSDCAKLRFGAAALDRWHAVIATGWNHNPRPLASTLENPYSCAVDCVGNLRAGVKSGTCVERCYAVHAEQHALLEADGRAYEIAVVGLLPDGSLFDNGGGFYCTVCARLMMAAGVEYVSVWSKGKRLRITINEAWEQSYRIITA